jgi:pSer/pThr/pTyr-binding forkhead associated (FHA) protein
MTSSTPTPATTMEEDQPGESAVDRPHPGLVMFFSVDRPMLRVFPLDDGLREVGWAEVAGPDHEDARISRRHLRVRHDGVLWHLEDLGSRNGSFVDGERLAAPVARSSPRVVRIGRTLLLPVADVRRFQRHPVDDGEAGVIGPTLRASWDAVGLAARAGDTLLITGESGTGKELAARAFHTAGPRPAGPFVAINCAAIPKGVAERLLFGARRGAYSGATADADGYLQAADGGTLFLDEIGDIDPAVQAKLLRVLELRAVTPLGAAHAIPIDLRVCAATCKDIQEQVGAGTFRDDLYCRSSTRRSARTGRTSCSKTERIDGSRHGHDAVPSSDERHVRGRGSRDRARPCPMRRRGWT